MTPTEATRRWSDTWKRAWEAFDTDAIVALYSVDALLSTEAFREPYRGRDGVRAYVSAVFGEEEDPHVWVGTPIVAGDSAAVPWWATLWEGGAETTLAGTSVLHFDVDGLVVEQWDAWNQAPGRRRPPADWGPFTTAIG